MPLSAGLPRKAASFAQPLAHWPGQKQPCHLPPHPSTEQCGTHIFVDVDLESALLWDVDVDACDKQGGACSHHCVLSIAIWMATSSRWFQDSCPPSSTCSLCKCPGLPRQQEGHWHLTIMASAFQESPHTPPPGDPVCNSFPFPWGTPVPRAILPPSDHTWELHPYRPGCVLPVCFCELHLSKPPFGLIIIALVVNPCKHRSQGRVKDEGKLPGPISAPKPTVN